MSMTIHGLGIDAVFDDDGLTVAVIRLSNTGVIQICWLPEVFRAKMPAEVQAAIAGRLRADADRLENGELDARMRSIVGRIVPHGES